MDRKKINIVLQLCTSFMMCTASLAVSYSMCSFYAGLLSLIYPLSLLLLPLDKNIDVFDGGKIDYYKESVKEM